MEIKKIHHHLFSGDTCRNQSDAFCIDHRCHLEVHVHSEGESVKLFPSSIWTVKACDGSCKRQRMTSLPKQMMDDVLAFLEDGKPRNGRSEDNIWTPK